VNQTCASLAAVLLLLAGCAGAPRAAPGDAVSAELLRLSDRALATANSGQDVRDVLREDLAAGHHDQVVRIAGHRFLLAPATLDTAPPGPVAGRYRWLVAQSVELAERACLPFQADEAGPFESRADGNGNVTLAAAAEGVQRVSVGIELRRGCIVALHVEQASAVPPN
jgi:hypothetical protein